ncbi:DnaA N-terminal domain-containing protein [Lentibacillus sediminis]|uniref:DnaA N-terminal domain-containing protein n=1 Tax=Lentibacillus sediminis TaxID=1940529 RepID=UPI000C1C2523|nr:DnaA N-terminal domain-containing protein [Lentibacillus sediminis]
MEFWPEVLNKISEKISSDSFDTWFVNTAIDVENDTITVYGANVFAKPPFFFFALDPPAKFVAPY